VPLASGGTAAISAPGVGSALITGLLATWASSVDVTVLPGLGSLAIAGHAPGVTQPAEEPRTGGAADRRKKKKRKPVAKVLTSLGDLSEVTEVYEPRDEPSAPVDAPRFSDLLRSLDAEQAARLDRDTADAERDEAGQREADEAAAKAAERQAAIETTRLAREQANAETAHRQKEANERREAQNKRVAAMQQAFDALVQRHRDQEEEDLEWLLLES
jgi:hypothetical protein